MEVDLNRAFEFKLVSEPVLFEFQDVDRALELIEDMRTRHIPRNVHTFTALMNVCIKCGRLPLALDVYASMRGAGCSPNVGEWGLKPLTCLPPAMP